MLLTQESVILKAHLEDPGKKVSQCRLGETPRELAQRLQRELGGDTKKSCRLYIDGGETVRGFLREGLLSDVCLTTLPVLIGRNKKNDI